MMQWFSRFWAGKWQRKSALTTPITPRDEDAELAELAALIESGDISEAALDRIGRLKD